MIKDFNISLGKENYSQRNNKVDPANACGPTNMIMAADYAGWNIPMSMYPELTQPEDKFIKFCRTDEEVLEYYKKISPGYYNDWVNESTALAKEQNKEAWEASCKDAYPPNEVHPVINFALNKFITGDNFQNCYRDLSHPTYYRDYKFNLKSAIEELLDDKPVVTSVRFGNCGHFVTIVGFTADDKAVEKFKKTGKFDNLEKSIKDIIIDNTYGRFNFNTMKYEKVSGNDEHIEVNRFLNIVKPVMHFFNKASISI